MFYNVERRSRIAVQVIVPILVSIMTATLSRLSSDSIASDHENCLSTEEIKFLQTDDQTIDLISQTNQNDTPVPEHDGTVSDNQSFKSTYESMTGINEIEENKSVTYNSTGPITKSEISKPVFQNGDKGVSRTSTNDIGDKTEESDEENSMVEAEENKIKKNEELSTFAKEQKDKRDDPVEETCTVVVENEKTSTKQHEEKSDGPGEEICTDEAKNNTIKENRELNTSKKEHLDKSDGSNDDICIDKAENILKIKENEELNTSEEDHIDDSDAKKFDTDNKKPSEQDNTDQSDELDAKKSDTDNKKPSEEDHIDESYAKKFDTDNTKPSDQYNTDHSDESNAKRSDTDNKKPSAQDNTDDNDELDAEKYDTENNKLSKSGTDNQDKRVNTETPNVTENATEENFDILLKGLEESKHESVDSGSDEIFDSENPKSND
ncbi:Hypothetical predicted protein [Mytilus galloprovincialis]|uniref:Uncharacterized protein n=1 Tax=Mytilus galloprovincialis TaxID=29158 RepID=A0A8B6HUM2_MYTGA|nr:Hypothetical predicted protein [Mytilus galloprovincialis]